MYNRKYIESQIRNLEWRISQAKKELKHVTPEGFTAKGRFARPIKARQSMDEMDLRQFKTMLKNLPEEKTSNI